MADKVLVLYGTKYGATKEIAEKIGEVIKQEGLEVDVRNGKKIGNAQNYNAFVIGSAVYAGFWRKEIVRFIRNYADILEDRPTWIFSSGPTGDKEAEETLEEWPYPPKLKPVMERIKPEDITMFHGAAFPEKLNILHKFMLKMVKAPTGDYRKWDDIEAWAKEIAGQLKK
ncbi:MAG: flavodoxin domain-containing protein [Dehalococcoidales bacterium]|nr:flavodoxin domain-containing protein [Dehalococcoidales bacterium]